MPKEVKINKRTVNGSKCNIVPGELNDYLFANQDKPLPQQVIQSIRQQSINILCKCVKAEYKLPGKLSETGLVIGYVQSGKTLSFTSVISLAADNNYKLVIVLAGRDILLLDQTDERLKNDLGQTKNKRKYSFFKNPGTAQKNDVLTQLENSRKPTIVITVLKHQKYLNALAEVLSHVKIANKISKLGVLVIDDEADQASLNTKALRNSRKETWEKDEYSAIYEGIINLRNTLHYHSYIQYTATPQANLLYDYLDILSPKWHEVLNPGDAYTGGKVFFKDHVNNCGKPPYYRYHFKLGLLNNYTTIYKNLENEKLIGCPSLIRVIPEEEKYHPTEKALQSPPDSLLECLRSFLINATIITELKNSKLNLDFVSMIIHLHSFTSSSKKALGWLQNILPQWNKDYRRNDKNLKNEFRQTFNEEEKVFKSGFTFESIYKNLEFVLTNYKIHLVLAGTKKIQWNDAQTHILIGGMKLDRGFTVENLTHTYMPRYSVSTSQADTIQQRCRFFGYKKNIIENCRVFLPADSICEYTDYVNDEEDLRNFLKKHDNIQDFFDTNQTLSLSQRLQPTRKNILSTNLVNNHLKGYKYFNPLAPTSFIFNLGLRDQFFRSIKKLKLKRGINYENLRDRTHDVYKVPLKILEERFLGLIQLDSPLEELFRKKTLRYFRFIEEQGKGDCFVINMSQGNSRIRSIGSRTVSKGKNGTETIYKITNPFSSYDPNNKPPKWPDDKDLISKDRYKSIYDYDNEVIIQFHTIKAKCPINKSIDGKEFVTVCIYFPPELAKKYIALNK